MSKFRVMTRLKDDELLVVRKFLQEKQVGSQIKIILIERTTDKVEKFRRERKRFSRKRVVKDNAPIR